MEENAEKKPRKAAPTPKSHHKIDENLVKPSSEEERRSAAKERKQSDIRKKSGSAKKSSVTAGSGKSGRNKSTQGAKKSRGSTRKAPPDMKEDGEEKKSAPVYQEVPLPEVGHRAKEQMRSISLSRFYPAIVVALLLVLILSALSVRLASTRSTRGEVALSDSGEYLLTIESGMNATEVSHLVGGITDEAEFLSYIEENGLATSIRAGSFIVPYGIEPDVLARALTGRSRNFTVFAGQTIEEIDESLSSLSFAREGQFSSSVEELVSERGLSFGEGWLLSGNYTYSSPYELAEAMNDAMIALIRDEADAVAKSGLSLDEIVILSSMINRETQESEDMKIIAGILLNRLALDMPLGVDATTRYETGNWSGTISESTFDRMTPYNTRRQSGLPPTGIGSPSPEAVMAVLHPTRSDDLYYLHDSEGNLYTSKDYETHLATYRALY